MIHMNFRPINDKVLLVYPQSMRKEGGVFIVGEAPNRMDAVVVAVGSKVSDAIRVGMKVVSDRLNGLPVTIDGVEYRLVPESEILASA